MTELVICYFCRHRVPFDFTVLVDLEGVGLVDCCETCWERSE